jgi:hypothetical protein
MNLPQQTKRGFFALIMAFVLSTLPKYIDVPVLGVSVHILAGICVGLATALFLLAIVFFVKPVKPGK